MAGQDDVKNAVETAVGAAVERFRADLVQSIVQGLPAPPAAPVVAPAGDGLRPHLETIMGGTAQVDIINRLMAAVGEHWNRAVLFLVKGNSFQAWALRGFAPGAEHDRVKAHAVPIASDTILRVALKGQGAQADNAQLADVVGDAEAAFAVAVAIHAKPAAVLYCDGPREGDAAAAAATEILACLAFAVIERTLPPRGSEAAVPLRGVAGAVAGAPPVVEAEPVAAVPAAPVVADEPSIPEAPAPVAAEIPSLTPAPEPAPAPPTPEPPAAPAPAPEPPAPEPKPAAPPAPAADLLKGSGAAPVVAAGEAAAPAKKYSRWTPVRDQVKGQEAVDPSLESVPEAERPKHVQAKKIAHLLVDEIKLYNEAKVAVGRKNKDLYERLKDDIERSRKTYLERVDPDVAAKTDYFRDELVAQLAGGDPEALGITP